MGLRYSGGSSVCAKGLRAQPDRGRSNRCSVSAMRAGMSRVPLALSTQQDLPHSCVLIAAVLEQAHN